MEQEEIRLVEKYQGQEAKVFLNNGAVLVGRIKVDGNWIEVSDERFDRCATCNLDHVVSISAI